MKSVFIFAAVPLALAGLLAAGCAQPPAPARAAAPPDGGDAQRVVALLDYVGGDYRRAVQGGQVLSPAEYEEQQRFVADAKRLAAGLLARGPAEASNGLPAAIEVLGALVDQKADPDLVLKAARDARERAVVRFDLLTLPPRRPSLPQAQALYAQNCATCHGGRGDGDTERARTLDPAPASFRDPQRLRDLSPYRVYNTLTFGVAGTAMPSFSTLPAEERWDLAFYVFRLGHEGEPVAGPVALSLGELSKGSDRELLDHLRRREHPAPEQGLNFARHEAAFAEPSLAAGVGEARQRLDQARAAYAAGQVGEAERLVLDAYLQGFEPLEARLGSRDPGRTQAVEAAFREARVALVANDAAGVRRTLDALDRALGRAADEGPRALPVVGAFVVYFREGIEAALLIGALLAGVRRLGRPEAARYVHAGWMAAVPAGVATWWVFDRLVRLGSSQRELLEAMVALLAAAVLFSVSFWMISKVESKHWLDYLRRNLEKSLGARNLGVLAGLSFLAVYREAAETVLFTQALLLDAPQHEGQVWLGALLGVAAVVVVGVVMSVTVRRLPLGPFFAVSSALLCALAVSFAGSGIYELVAAGYLSPRPVALPEIPWMGIHPDLSVLAVQLTILAVLAYGALSTAWRKPAEERATTRPR